MSTLRAVAGVVGVSMSTVRAVHPRPPGTLHALSRLRLCQGPELYTPASAGVNNDARYRLADLHVDRVVEGCPGQPQGEVSRPGQTLQLRRRLGRRPRP